jgi:hypothetical protein
MKSIPAFVLVSIFGITGCASSPQIAIDPNSVKDKALLQKDMADCKKVSETYDLGKTTGANAVVGAAAGGATVAGVATAIAGAVFAPAIPFIVAGSVAGAGVGGGSTQMKESAAREKILGDCMTERGYKVYTAN